MDKRELLYMALRNLEDAISATRDIVDIIKSETEEAIDYEYPELSVINFDRDKE